MSDTTVTTEAPANESAEPAYGREGLERAAGYTPMVDEFKPEEPEELTKDDAAKRLKELSGPESAIVTHTTGLDPEITLTLDQSAEMLAESREADKSQAELDATKKEQKAIDKLRGENAGAAAPQIETEVDIERALASPKIRDAIAERVTAADGERTRYEAAVLDAGKFAIASLVGDFPELENLPLTNWVSAIQAMHQREPARAQQAIARLQALGRVEAAANQIKADKTAREQTEFKTYSVKENARFTELTKGISAREMAAIEAHVPKMLAESGANVKQFLDAVSNQTTFPRASAEALLVKAARYDLLAKAAKVRPTHNVPSVQRPGFSGPRVDRAETGLAQLSAKLSKTGNLKDAAALLSASRRNKGR
jgi:hypothetical protein